MTDHLGFYLSDIARLMRKHFDEAARDMGVTGAQWRVLFTLVRMPGINQGQIAERLEVEPITTCRMIDRLEQAGLVERRRDPADRRVWQIHLTAAAQPLLAELEAIADRMTAHSLRGFSPVETTQLRDMLDRLRTNLLEDLDQDARAIGDAASHGKEVHHG
ncbi:MarR family winged helix-turn-helix transcriptional regulator [Sphingobium algorifonticola]|uniref:MarR family transcriptional regulator n=1 Tax=Sphingobium algorifonticola TaxID=2008318 RepID=A0A437J6T8_9SPHN|nr:MarR family transcriptional regulator [Sphingobium algorifonticola]RVT40888.1 MarR family transcriptional regulator [Sphingobium algorifonticola]